MTDTIEAVAEAIRKHQAENRVWKMRDLAQAAYATVTKALIEQAGEVGCALEAWAPLVSSGYEVPAAGQKMHDAAATIAALIAEIERAREALKPFADCLEYIADDEDDEEWAKFRLLIKDYRRAARALDAAAIAKGV